MMQKISLLLILIALILPANPQGTYDDDKDVCTPELRNYLLLKSFEINQDAYNPPKEHKIIMSKGSRYRIFGCSGSNSPQIRFELFSKTGSIGCNYEGCNYNKSMNKYYRYFDFRCNQTGVYYVKCHFKDSKKGKGVITIGFSRVVKMMTSDLPPSNENNK